MRGDLLIWWDEAIYFLKDTAMFKWLNDLNTLPDKNKYILYARWLNKICKAAGVVRYKSRSDAAFVLYFSEYITQSILHFFLPRKASSTA